MAAASSEGGFDRRETAVINSGQDYPALRLYTVDDNDDLEILRRRCDPVNASIVGAEDFGRLVERMLATVTDPDNTGVGIAAPQVGISKRIILVQRFDKEGEPFECYLNPSIVEASPEMVESPEGCLSIPDVRKSVLRHRSITIEYNRPTDFGLCRETIDGFTAIVFQHETDHLDGILFTDKTIIPDGED
ncbi:MAG: peptide deformylase [Rikenellaceae bacterium]|nr:peptide deformylase [Rikenellaceae bacterium]